MPWFDDYFSRFLAGALRAPISWRPQQTPIAWTNFNSAVEDAWLQSTRALIGEALQPRNSDLPDTIRRVAPTVDANTFGAFAAARLCIQSDHEHGWSAENDFFYVKINHGFWEQIYRVFANDYDAARMRIGDPAPFRASYVTSGFLDALDAAIQPFAVVNEGTLHFERVRFGVNLWNGAVSHQRLLADFSTSPLEAQRIAVGAAIGLVSYFSQLCGASQLRIWDGNLPKEGLKTGVLKTLLDQAAAHSARVIFVVPPHLRGIRLSGASLPQENIFVSGSTVHESWAATLYHTAKHVLARLQTDGRVTVITQSAVFSALLGLFLARAKDELCAKRDRLYFFDLGQALDVANPTCGGTWVTAHKPTDPTLFHLTPT